MFFSKGNSIFEIFIFVWVCWMDLILYILRDLYSLNAFYAIDSISVNSPPPSEICADSEKIMDGSDFFVKKILSL